MHFSSLASLALVAIPAALAQDILFDAAHNATPIVGTWSSGSKAVSTGSVRLPVNAAARARLT